MCTVSTKTLSTTLGKFFWLHPQIAHDDHQGPNYYLAVLHFMLSLMLRKQTRKQENFRFSTTVLSVTVLGLMKSQMSVNCLDRSSLLWNCMLLMLMLLVFLGEPIRFQYVLNLRNMKGHLLKQMYPIIPSLSKTWDAKSTKLCIQKIPRNLHKHISTKYTAVDKITYIII
jgi:hypothetical protein